jgi:hypothetical protein
MLERVFSIQTNGSNPGEFVRRVAGTDREFERTTTDNAWSIESMVGWLPGERNSV